MEQIQFGGFMSEIKNGDTVKVHYTGKLADGSVFDSSRERDPLEFTLGKGQLIPGFEKAVEGMKKGDSTVINIPAKDAYGEWNKNLLMEIEKEKIPSDIDPQVGMQLESVQSDGRKVAVQINEIREKTIVLDANHPLAGKELIFDIEVVEIQAKH